MAQPTHHKKIWYAPNRMEAYGEEEIKAVEDCLRSGWLAPGPLTDAFEKGVAAHFGKNYGVMVNSGSSANLLCLAVAGIGPGDEVVTPACTFSTTVAPIVQLGGSYDAPSRSLIAPRKRDCPFAVNPSSFRSKVSCPILFCLFAIVP
jgi:hypothetical protein